MYMTNKQQKTTQSRYPLTDRDNRMIVLSGICSQMSIKFDYV